MKMRMFFAFVISFFDVICGQFPRSCTDKQSIASRQCCPVGKDGSKCGEATNRGLCQLVSLEPAGLSINETFQLLLDDRAAWPSAYYDRTCVCMDNFYGVDCSSCKPGYEGEKCEQRSPLRVRRNITSLSKSQLLEHVKIMDKSKRVISKDFVILTTSFDRIRKGEIPEFRNASVYDMFVWMHYYVTRNNFVFPDDALNRRSHGSDLTLENRLDLVESLLNENITANLRIEANVDYAHEGPAFLPWHRLFMLKWEAELRELVAEDPNFTLPYWDWRDQQTCDVCNDVMLGAKSQDNDSLLSENSPFSKWRVICSRGNEYLLKGEQCSGNPEGPILRNFGSFDLQKITGLPTSSEVENVFRLGGEYDTRGFDRYANNSYRNLLEGFADPDTGEADAGMSYVHNAVHLYMNGTMSSVDTSANDPIFVVHHIFVDSLFEKWIKDEQKKNSEDLFNTNEGPRVGHRPQDFMVPFFPLVRNIDGFEGTNGLGYVYDYLDELSEESDTENKTSTSLNNEMGSGTTDNFSVFTKQPIAGSRLNKTNSRFSHPLGKLVFPDNKGNEMGKSRLKKNRKFNKGKRSQSNLSRFAEGGYSFRRKASDYTPAADDTNMLMWQGLGMSPPSSYPDTSASVWDKLQRELQDIDQAFKRMDKSDIVWLLFACIFLAGCACILACICRSKSQFHSRKRKLYCCCCVRYSGEKEESFALLESSYQKPYKAKVVKGTKCTCD